MKSISYFHNLLIDSLLTPIVESTYLNRDMCKFESSQKDESRWQSTDSLKAYRNTSAFKWKNYANNIDSCRASDIKPECDLWQLHEAACSDLSTWFCGLYHIKSSWKHHIYKVILYVFLKQLQNPLYWSCMKTRYVCSETQTYQKKLESSFQYQSLMFSLCVHMNIPWLAWRFSVWCVCVFTLFTIFPIPSHHKL